MVTFDLGEGPVPGGRPAGPSRSGSRSQHRSSARRAPRKANTRRNAAPDWGDLAGLTFEEIDALEQEQLRDRRRRPAGRRKRRAGILPPAQARAARPWTSCWRCRRDDGGAGGDGEREARAPCCACLRFGDEFADAEEGDDAAFTEAGRLERAETEFLDCEDVEAGEDAVDLDDAAGEAGSDDADAGDGDGDGDDRGGRRDWRQMSHLEREESFRDAGAGATLREWWEWWHSDHVFEDVVEGVGNAANKAFTAAKATLAKTAKETGEYWIGNLLDLFFNQQRHNFLQDPLMPEWLRWRCALLWDEIFPDIKLEIMHLLTNVESRIGLISVRRGSVMARELDRSALARPQGAWRKVRAHCLYHSSPHPRRLPVSFFRGEVSLP